MTSVRITLTVAAILLAAAVNAGEEPSLYPVNAVVFKLVDPEGREMPFLRTMMDYNYLEGLNGWCAKLYSRKSVATTGTPRDPSSGIRYEFDAGLLTSVYTNGVKSSFVPGKPSESLASLYPDADYVAQRLDVAKDNADIWEKSGRLRLFGSNPNKTGTVIAGLFLLFVSLALCNGFGKVQKIAFGAISALSVVALLLTESRGAFLGALVGLFSILIFHFRHGIKGVPVKKIVVPFVVLLLAVSAAMYFHVGDRFTRKLFETGGTNAVRVDIFKNAPYMMADAPSGWGMGNSGAAYCMWYRDAEVRTTPRTLLNSHLTWMVEIGNIARFAYLFGWALVLMLLGYAAWRGHGAFPFACVLSLGISAMFNHVMEDWVCLALPVIGVAVGIWRLRPVRWRHMVVISFLSAAVAAVALVLLLNLGKRNHSPLRIRFDGKAVVIGGEKAVEPKIWIVGDEFVLGGWDFIGKEFEQYVINSSDAPAIAYVEKLDDLPAKVEKLVLAGLSAAEYLERWRSGRREDLCRSSAMLFLSPSVPLMDVPEDLMKETRLRGVVGSLAARRVDGYAESKPSWVRIAPGCLLYITGWMPLAVGF